MKTLKRLILLSVCSAMAVSSASASGSTPVAIKHNLYYPVQTGSYKDIKLRARTTAPMPNPCEIGTIYLNDLNVAMYCFHTPGAATGEWAPLTGPWKIENDAVTISPFYSASELRVGLGTTTPPFKLTVKDQGGVIAKGTVDSGDTVPEIGVTSPYWGLHAAMLWNPRKAALRAGTNQGMRWNDSYLGKYSVALGNSPGAWGDYSSSLSGYVNDASGTHSAIGGGQLNGANSLGSTVGGGYQNWALSQGDFVGGGQNNAEHHIYATVYGGKLNRVMSVSGTVIGGENNLTSAFATIIGGKNNYSGNQYWNSTENLADMDANWAGATEEYEVIGGGLNNRNGNAYTTIGGGEANETRGQYATIVGGKQNSAGGHYSTILGGFFGQTRGRGAVILGGHGNTVLAKFGVIDGGHANTTTGNYATVLGGLRNGAAGVGSVIAGGSDNTAIGDYSWPAGRGMQVGALSPPMPGHRSFLWGYNPTPIVTYASDAFMIYNGHVGINNKDKFAVFTLGYLSDGSFPFNLLQLSSQGGVAGDKLTITKSGFWGVGKVSPAHPLDFGPIAQNAKLTNGGQWVPGSSRTFKDNIKPLSSETAESVFTALEPVSYTYKNTPDDLSLGFIAEEVPELMAMPDRKSMTRTPLLSVLTKVIQEQDQTLEEQNNEIELLKERVEKLKQSRMEK